MSEQEKTPTLAQIRELYYRPGEAAKALGMTRDAFNHYVKAGLIQERRILGTHRYFLKSDIQKIIETFGAAVEVAEQLFPRVPGQWKNNPSSTFELATSEDMPRIVEISRAIFNTDGSAPISANTRLEWMRANPEAFFVLRDHAGMITGYTSMFPIKRQVLDRFIRDEIEAEDITADDVLPFEPGQYLHLYVMAIGIDPRHSTRKKHEYGARLVTGLYHFLLDLARRGVEIETITARSHKPDGIRLLRKMGIPQLRSPVASKALFVVRPAESGFPLFVQYIERLQEWKAAHRAAAPHPLAPRPRTPHALPASAAAPELPAGTLHIQDFLQLHNLKAHRRRVIGYLDAPTNGLEHHAFPKPGREDKETDRFLTPDQQEALLSWLRAKHPEVFA